MGVRRFVLAVLMMALCLGCADAAVSVRMDDAAVLLTEDGAERVPAGAFADIVSLGDSLFAASPDGELYALMDETGALLSGALYGDLRLDAGLLLARRGGAWGLLDRGGAERGAFVYSRIETDGIGCWALRGEEEPDALLLMDSAGSMRDSGLRVLRIGEASEGLLPVLLESGFWGVCDAAGRMAVPAELDYIESFVAGRAVAVSGGLYGAMDGSGAWVAAPAYDFLEISAEGYMLAVDAGGAYLLDSDGSELAAWPGEDIYAAIAGTHFIIGDGETLRVFDAAGSVLAELAPDAAVSEGVGEQLVISEGMWGEACVRLLGTGEVYQNLYPLGTANGEPVYAYMEVNAARYENDLLHEIQISVDMDTARYGLANGAGERLLPCDYLSVEFLSDDRFLARTESQWQLIDSSGKVYWRRRVTRIEASSF